MHAATYFDFKEIQNFELFAQFLVFYFFFSAAGVVCKTIVLLV